MPSALRIHCSDRFLEVAFDAPQQMLSWAIVGGGRRLSDRVVWHYVSRAELPESVDPVALFEARLRERGLSGAVGLLTARELAPFVHVEREREGLRAACVATVGLGNALRVGDPSTLAPARARVGTINVLCHLSEPLGELALLEAMALVVEARTAALLDCGYPSRVSGRPSSGTGTDCCVMAASTGGEALTYAGKHTLAGELIGAVVEQAVSEATRAWLAEQQAGP